MTLRRVVSVLADVKRFGSRSAQCFLAVFTLENTTENTEMLHTVNVRVNAGLLNENSLLPEVSQILQVVRPAWSVGNIQSKHFTGGASNVLYGYFEEGNFEKDVVLIRVDGEGTEKWLFRAQEKRNMQALHEIGCSAPLYAEFENGIAYGYVPGVTLDVTSVKDEKISRLIAKEMCRFHSARPEGLEPVCGQWKSADVRMTILPDGFPEDPEKHKRYLEHLKPKQVLIEEYKKLRDHLISLNSPVVFCHNDLLPGNIIYNTEKDSIHFIDFEYSKYNYEHYEVALHFFLCTGPLEDLDFRKYPDKTYQLKWIRNYLCCKAELNGGSEADVTEVEVEEFYGKCRQFAMAPLFFLGIWGLVQATMSKLDFDFLGFSIRQLGDFFARKDEYLT